MSEEKPAQSSSAKKPRKRPSRFVKVTRELVAAGLWSYIVVKLFIYDVDRLLIASIAPSLDFVLRYRFFLIVGTVALLWLILGTRRFRSFILYILFYPLIVLLWKIPALVFKNWATLLVFAPAIHTVLTTFRARFITLGFGVLGALAILASQNKPLLVSAMAILMMVLVSHYLRRFHNAFSPSSVFADMGRLIRRLWEGAIHATVLKQIREAKDLDPESEEYAKKRFETLQSLYIFNKVTQVIALKADEVMARRRIDIYFITSLLYTFVLTVIVFALQYFALEKVSSGSFDVNGTPNIWLFIAYSFNTLITADLGLAVPKNVWATVLCNMELAAGVFILIILVFVLTTIIRERYRDDMKLAIDQLRRQATQLEDTIRKEYELSIPDAEAKLIEANPEFKKTIELFAASDPQTEQ